MYRYRSPNRFNYVMKSNRFRPLLILAVLGLAVFLIIKLAGGGGLNEANFENHRNAKIRSEMQHAVSQTNSLSRLGASSTSGALGRIRQYIHGVEVVNDLNVSMYGEVGRLYQQSYFDQIYTVIDAFDAKLSSGQKVNDSLAALTEAITLLNDYTNTTVLGHGGTT